uniref:Uncharacterized protein n=1 Tax=Rhizophora mucronata TaxID=61149 RepID=A0A2P2NR35_RHIMU
MIQSNAMAEPSVVHHRQTSALPIVVVKMLCFCFPGHGSVNVSSLR